MENVEYFNCLVIKTNDARRTCEIKSRIAMSNATFQKNFYLNLRKKLVKCYIWSIAFYGVENWTLRQVDQKYLESLEMWCCRRMEKMA
jgi:hypothetical protein